MIKKALLEEEVKNVKNFLKKYNLTYDNGISDTFYIEENDKIIATASIDRNIIKCLLVEEDKRNSNYLGLLVTHIINFLYNKKITNYFVITKQEYLSIFENFGFSKMVATDTTVFLEGGSENIFNTLEKYKKNIETTFGINIKNHLLSSIVLNANPFTKGHQYLVEYARNKSEFVIVFVLEEDKSFYTFKERFAQVYLGCSMYKNVIVMPSSFYIISRLTFPSYFLKEESYKNKEWMNIDIDIFKNYFMKYLNIKKRFVGSEDNEVMLLYNKTLKEKLLGKIEIIPRVDNISASQVRKLVKDNLVNEALEFIPNETKSLFLKITEEKYE